MTIGEEFEALIAECASKAYPEPETLVHTELSDQMCEWFLKVTGIQPGWVRVLDLGSGRGCGLDAFAKRGFPKAALLAINADRDDDRAVREKGYPAFWAEMHEFDEVVPTGLMDVVWMRHILEHSPCPLLVLKKAYKVLQDGGHIYVECPAPESACKHAENPGHFTVLTPSGWKALIERAGFTIVDSGHIELTLTVGNDTYFMFAAKK